MALNTLQRLVCHKTQRNKHTNYLLTNYLSMYVCMCVCVCVCEAVLNNTQGLTYYPHPPKKKKKSINQPTNQPTKQMTKSKITREECDIKWIFKRITACLNSLRSVAVPRSKSPVCPTFYQKEKRGIHVFPKGISMYWNVNILVQVLKSDRWIHFLRRLPLHRKEIYGE